MKYLLTLLLASAPAFAQIDSTGAAIIYMGQQHENRTQAAEFQAQQLELQQRQLMLLERQLKLQEQPTQQPKQPSNGRCFRDEFGVMHYCN